LEPPARGWRRLLEKRRKLAVTGFLLDAKVGADVPYAESEQERDFIHWMHARVEENPRWCDELGEWNAEFLRKFPAPSMPRRNTSEDVYADTSGWVHKKRQQFRVLVHEDQVEAEFCETEDSAIDAQYPPLGKTWAKYEVAQGFHPRVPRLAYIFGLCLCERPFSSAQTTFSRTVWVALHTLWIRNVAFNLLSQAGVQAYRRRDPYDGRLWHLSDSLRIAMQEMGTVLLVGERYARPLDELLEYIDVIHWGKVSPQRNIIPRANRGGIAPVHATGDFVLFDVYRWRPMVPKECMGRNSKESDRKRGERFIGDTSQLDFGIRGARVSDLRHEYVRERVVAEEKEKQEEQTQRDVNSVGRDVSSNGAQSASKRTKSEPPSVSSVVQEANLTGDPVDEGEVDDIEIVSENSVLYPTRT